MYIFLGLFNIFLYFLYILFNFFYIYFTNVNDYYLFCKLKNNAKDLNLNKNIKMYYTYLFKKNINREMMCHNEFF